MSPNAASDRGLATSAGTKVTKDPASQQPIAEAPGIITSDSLAAESRQHGGAFGSDSTSRTAPSDQPSKGTTTNNTDTSSATILPPAKDKAERDESGDASSRVDEKFELEKGKGENDGRGPTYANSGDTTGSSGTTKNTTTTDTSEAPSSYAAAIGGESTGGSSGQTQAATKPTNPNLSSTSTSTSSKDTEFKGNEPNASFSGAIGTEDDPGLLAERKIQATNAQSAADAGLPRQAGGQKIEDESQYKVLDETSS